MKTREQILMSMSMFLIWCRRFHDTEKEMAAILFWFEGFIEEFLLTGTVKLKEGFEKLDRIKVDKGNILKNMMLTELPHISTMQVSSEDVKEYVEVLLVIVKELKMLARLRHFKQFYDLVNVTHNMPMLLQEGRLDHEIFWNNIDEYCNRWGGHEYTLCSRLL